MILIIDTCADRLHSLEFVKPVEDILKKSNCRFFTRHYSKITQKDRSKAEKFIICGTSLKDNEFMKHADEFSWLSTGKKPVFGICAGMQIIGKVFGGVLKKATEIGLYKESFREFLGLSGEEQVYHLHDYYIDFLKIREFDLYSRGKIPQAVKHKSKEIYGVLFHPEVRQKKLIENFAGNARK